MTAPAFIERLSPAELLEARALMIECWIRSPTQESAQDALTILKRRAPLWLLEKVQDHPHEALLAMSAVVKWGTHRAFFFPERFEDDVNR